MPDVIISDTSCFILLDKIGELQLLKDMYGQVTITLEIAGEFGKSIPDWVQIKNALNVNIQNVLSTMVDKGEASALALAMEQTGSFLILDDHKARKLANDLKLEYTGTLGFLVVCKLEGKIKFIRPLLNKIKQTNFRLAEDLEYKILEKAGEL